MEKNIEKMQQNDLAIMLVTANKDRTFSYERWKVVKLIDSEQLFTKKEKHMKIYNTLTKKLTTGLFLAVSFFL